MVGPVLVPEGEWVLVGLIPGTGPLLWCAPVVVALLQFLVLAGEEEGGELVVQWLGRG